MTNFVVIAHVPTSGKATREMVIKRFVAISQFSKENDPDMLRYIVCVPRDESDETSVYLIEEFVSKEAFDAHLACEPAQAFLAYVAEHPEITGGEMGLSFTENWASFTRPEAVDATDPWICFASIGYKEGKRAEALEAWKHVTSETEKNEKETLSYAILKDNSPAETIETIKTVEVYASEAYFKEVHVPSKAVQENAKNYGNDIRVSLKHVFLKMEGGFLRR